MGVALAASAKDASSSAKSVVDQSDGAALDLHSSEKSTRQFFISLCFHLECDTNVILCIFSYFATEGAANVKKRSRKSKK